MWIWELARSDGGNLGNLIADAHRYGVSTLFVKSGDGTSIWSQFNSSLVSALHARGLRVCAWQYVYGNHPITEAYVGAAAVKAGADCLVIDAESEYEGKYVAGADLHAQLRKLIGPNYPIVARRLPVRRLPPRRSRTPCSSARRRAVQHCRRCTGATSARLSMPCTRTRTSTTGSTGARSIPLGQTYNGPRLGQIMRFRQLSRSYGAAG